MKNTKKIWQRVLAMALVLMMVLSYMPSGVVAVGTPAEVKDETIVLLEATLTATKAEVPEGEEPEGETPATYTYAVAVSAKGEAVTNAVITGMDNEDEAVVVAYKGMTVTLNKADAQTNGSVSGSVKVTYKTAHNLTKGQSYDENQYVPTVTAENAVAEGTWTFEKNTDIYDTYINNDVVCEVENNLTFGAYKYAIGEEVLAEIPLVHNISEPEYTVTLTVPETREWYAEVQTVTIKAVANVKLAEGYGNPPEVIAEDAHISQWSSEDNQTFTATVNVAKTTEIQVGDQTLMVQIDTVTPEISNVKSYNVKGNTVVEFDVTVGDSGIAEVKINNETCDFTGGNHVTVTVDEKLGEGFTIAVTSKAGLTGIANGGTPEEELSVVIAEPADVIGITTDKTYVAAGTEFTATVYYAIGTITPTVTDQNNNPVTMTWEGNKGTFQLAAGETLNGLKVYVKDDKNREAEAGFTTVYAVDNTAPVIKITGKQTTELTYVKEEQTYTVTITDDAILGNDYSAKYYLAGDEEGKPVVFENGVGEIKLTHGMNLVRIEASATDATGNAAPDRVFDTNILVDTKDPKITAELTAINKDGNAVSIRGFYENAGKYFAILNPVETNETDGTVTLTMVYTLEEDYPDAAYLTADGWTSSEGVWTKSIPWTVEENTTDAQDIGVTAKDLAQRVSADPIIIKGEDETLGELVLTPGEGVYTGMICVDRRTPSTGDVAADPEVELALPVTELAAANGKPLYNGNFSFDIHVTDASSFDSGVATVAWQVTGADFLDDALVTKEGAGEYTISVTAEEAGECNEVTLMVSVTDNVGNTYTKTRTFAFDNLAPRVSVSYNEGTVTNENFFNAPRTATVTYDDLNLSTAKYTKNDTEQLLLIEEGKAVATVEFAEDGHHTLRTYAADLAQNENALSESTAVAPYDFYVDTTAPVVKVLQKTAATQVGVDGDAEYYNNVVTYTITASDTYMDAGKENVEAWVKYTKELANGETEEKEIDLLAAEGRKTVITVTDGETLTDLQVYACDNAGWTTDLNTELDFAESEETDGVYQFNKDTAVDMTPAEVSVKRTGKLVQTVGGVDYYDDVVTYELTIADRFQLKADAMKVEVKVDYNNAEDLTLSLENLTWDEKIVDPAYTASFTVEDGTDISGMTIVVKDNAGNITKTIDVGEDALTAFAYKKDQNVYTGNRVVVDKTAPAASMAFSSNVKSVYTNKGTVYVVLDEPATGSSGFFASQPAQTVTVTITAKDENIALHETSVKTNEGKGKWAGKIEVNTDSELTYTQSIEVNADKTGAFAFDLTVRDLAGNALKELAFTPIDNTYAGVAVEKDGSFGTTVSVDRRRPSSVDDDNAAPVITIAPSIAPTTSSNGLELFSNAFNFGLTVTDGASGILNSGIKTVNWKIEDSVGFVAASGADNGQPKGTYTKAFTIPVAVNGVGESNAAKLTIVAVDNVGNTTTYVKEFAVDNQGPRIVVNYDNNSAQNGKYFKANRTATIEVTDINFNAQTTQITTQVAPTDWVQNGSTWTSTCSYTEDGEYTFAVRSVDLANNATEDAAVDYEGEVAPKDFVIDKTAPVISVTYDPSAPIGKDAQNVNYYDKELGVTVNIREVNFNAADVKAVFNSNNSLGGFAGGNGSYSAHETFTEGNAYHFTINYTDLAGNAANTYDSTTFSVDLTDPTIAITGGDMTEANLNIVQGSLVLEFTINDEQSNLESYDVKVTRLNNAFKEETVSGKDYYTISSADERTKVVVDFESILKEKSNDGIYTVELHAKDYAGRDAAMTVQFSLNRFGSTFTTDDPFTQGFLAPSADGAVYQNVVGQKLIFKEINPNKVWQDSTGKVEGSMLTIVVNGTTTVLKEGTDYTMSVAQEGTGKAKWYVYTYEVDPSIFMQNENLVDGRYALLIYGQDEAGNKNTNESNEFGGIQQTASGEYSGKIEFTLDATAPIISTTGIETGGSYNAENQAMKIFLSDNTPVGIVAYLNGQAVELLETAGAANAAWLVWDAAEGCYVLNVPEQNTLFGRQSVEIKVTDAAGNSAESVVDDFTVSSNLFVRFVNSVWFWIVSGALVLLVLLLVVFLNKKKKAVAA